MWMHVCLGVHMHYLSTVPKEDRRGIIHPGTVVTAGCDLWVLVTQPQSSARAPNALNSTAPLSFVKWFICSSHFTAREPYYSTLYYFMPSCWADCKNSEGSPGTQNGSNPCQFHLDFRTEYFYIRIWWSLGENPKLTEHRSSKTDCFQINW